MNTTRQCIVCTKVKPVKEFNIEHTFPAAIGGVFTTDKVCAECNTKLNQNVDEPFVKSNFVIKYRHDFNLNRDSNRGIPSITKKPVKNAEGNDVLLKFKEGKLKTETIDQFNHKIHGDGKIECTLTIDPDKAHLKDEIITKMLGRLSKELNTELGDYTIVKEERKPTKEFDHVVSVPNNLLIKECLKVAYEMASITSPNYIEDEIAKKITNYLLHDVISEEFKKQLDEVGINKFKKYTERLGLFNIPLYHHSFFIENVQNEGVYAVVKIFNYIYPIMLTKNNELFPKEELLMSIDIIDGTLYFNHSIDYQMMQFNLDPNSVSEIIKQNIHTLGIAYFEHINNSLVFYNDKGKVKHQDLDSLCRSVVKEDKLFEQPNTGHLVLNLVGKNMFIKTMDGLLLQLWDLTVVPKNVVQQLPKTPS